MLAGLCPCLRCGVGGYIPLYTSSQPTANWGKGEESDKTTNSVLKAKSWTAHRSCSTVPCVCWVPGILLAPRWEDTTSVVARLLTED